MPYLDIAALALFLVFWLFYEPLLPRVMRSRQSLNDHMVFIRLGWMHTLVGRSTRFIDSQLLGHTIHSASFFGSANMIVIAALAGFMFGGEASWARLNEVEFLRPGPTWLLEFKLALMLLTLARGMLDFVWGIRQLNYCLAAIGAVPDDVDPEARDRWAETLSAMLNPALKTFSRGVRAYYFTLAAACWFFGPLALAIASIGAVLLLGWRQTRSPSARAIAELDSLVQETTLRGK